MDWVEQFLDAMWMERGLAENTLMSYRNDLTKIIALDGATRLPIRFHQLGWVVGVSELANRSRL
ncbi:site-specific integrase [Vibrio metschnikovii]